MFARVMSTQVHPERLDHMIEIIRNSSLGDSQQQSGFNGVYGLVDRSSGRGMIITLWESAEDLENAEASGVLSHALSQVLGCMRGPAICETFEVAVAS